MSRFFASGDTDSESEEENVEEEEEVQEEAPGPNRFDFESSESEEEHRVVRSEKDKRFEGLQNTIKLMKNHIKINDWMAINKDYDALLLLLDKAGKVIAKEGVPKFFLKQLTDLDALTEKTFKDKDTKAKMNKNNAQGLAAIRQKLRKAKDKFKKELEAYQKDPLKDDAPDDDDDDGQADKKDKPKKKAKRGGDTEDKGDGESDESDAEKDSGSESDAEADEILKNQQGAMFDRNFWVKKPLTEEQKKKQDAAEAKKLEKKRRQQNRPAVKALPVRTDEDLKKKEEEKVTPEMVVKRLKEVLADRGKRGTDKLKTIEELKFLATKTTIPVTLLKIKTCLAAALFDVSLNSGQHMETGHWRECYDCLFDILDQLTENKTLRLSEDEEVKDSVEEEMLQQALKSKEEQKQAEEVKQKTAAAENKESKEVKTAAVDAKTAARQAAEEKEDYSGQVQAGKEGEVLYVIGNLYAFVLRMVAEFRAALQNTDPHSEDYIVRLKDEPLLLNLVTKVQSYYTTIKKTHLEAQVAMLRLELIYWHYSAALDVQKQAIDLKSLATAHPAAVGARIGVDAYKSDASHPGSLSVTAGSDNLISGKEEKEKRRGGMKPDPCLVVPLASLLYRQADKRLSTRALLCHIYHLALHNKYQEAHDLLLMSHVQETIEGADIPTRILFNRAMAQIGLCAFRIGEFRQSLYCLADLYQSSRIKELLAQGQSQSQRYQEKDEQEERAEKLRQYPFHMHINLDLIESAHLISAMLAEVPNFAMHGQANKKRLISKSFRRLWEYHQKQPFNGPPETTRDLIMAASKALMTGDWKKTQQFLLKLRMWNLVRNGDQVKANLQAKVQEEALRTYLLTYSGHYQTLSLKFLCDMFELPSKAVHKMASKMMVNEQLAGAWDQPSATIVMHPVDQSRLQKAALKFVDRATQFVEQNERMLDPRSGFFKDDYRDRDRDRPQGLGLGGEREGGYSRGNDDQSRGGDSSERDGGNRPQRRDRDFVRRKWRDNYRERDRGDRERGGDRSSYQQYQQYQEPADGKQ